MRGEIRRIDGGKDAGKDGFFPPEGPPRRLAAILAADIAGYSRLMGIDEEGTHARVKRYRRELIDPAIAEHHGKLIKNTGDGFIAMFDSPVEAVRCAVVIQQSMVGRNASLPRAQWVLYRIGVNLGDVIVEAEDIFGDGVNIAARLEGIAEPGDVYISGGVYEQIKNKLVCGYQSLGDRKVKNITDPISVYRVLPDPAAVLRARTRRGHATLAAAVVIGFAIAGGAAWYFLIGAPSQIMSQAPPPIALPQAPAQPASQPPPLPAPAPAQTATQPAPQPAPLPAPVAPTPAPATSPEAPQVAITAPSPPPPPLPQSAGEPEMVSLPGGVLAMGSNEDPSEKPIHHVTVKPFAIGKFPVTVGEWNACVAAKGCTYVPTGKDDAPVTNLSWNDTQQFTAWLSRTTQKKYRLPSEAEWEYASRGGTDTKYWWGERIESGMVNCKGCNEPYDPAAPVKVGSFKPNHFGLYDLGGGADQWVADCWHKNYQGAPTDGSPWIDSDCSSHVIRGGSWKNDPSYVRPASRDHYDTAVRYPTHGFRVARSL
jgi:formylglycine-generating enzyme required for sulfatase activity/class 3 adenylate cyclase